MTKLKTIPEIKKEIERLRSLLVYTLRNYGMKFKTQQIYIKRLNKLLELEIKQAQFQTSQNIYDERFEEFIKKLDKWKEIMRTWHIELPTINLLCSEFDRFKNKLAGKDLVKEKE